jgi:hypothetical protein
MVDEVGPVCNVKGVVKFPDQKLNPFQAIPKATDLPSAIKAIQAITNNFNTLAKFGNYVEYQPARTFEIVRVFNPTNTAQWVDVAQITGLLFVDPVSGRTITWRQ